MSSKLWIQIKVGIHELLIVVCCAPVCNANGRTRNDYGKNHYMNPGKKLLRKVTLTDGRKTSREKVDYSETQE